MSWHLGPLGPFDVESTGTDVENDRIVTATAAHIVPSQQPVVTSHLIAVDVDIPQDATNVHGITTEHARANGKPCREVLETVAAQLSELMGAGIPIIGMNIAFDFTLLDRELRRNSLPTLEDRLGREIGPVIDIFVIDKAIDRYRKGSRKLVDLCGHYGVRHGGAHDATEDALAAARVAWAIGSRSVTDPAELLHRYADRRPQAPHIARAFQQLGVMTLAELMEAQRRWYAEQSESFAQFLRRKSNEERHRGERASDPAERETALKDAEDLLRRADEVSPHWPMRPWVGAA